jgi:hypothetical protein
MGDFFNAPFVAEGFDLDHKMEMGRPGNRTAPF